MLQRRARRPMWIPESYLQEKEGKRVATTLRTDQTHLCATVGPSVNTRVLFNHLSFPTYERFPRGLSQRWAIERIECIDSLTTIPDTYINLHFMSTPQIQLPERVYAQFEGDQ